MPRISLKDKYPKLWNELDINKNKEEFPKINLNRISPGSHTKLWWICRIHGNYLQSPGHRIYMNTSCPKCGKINAASKISQNRINIAVKNKSTLKILFPDIWNDINIDETKKLFPNLDIKNITCSNKKKIFWNCKIHGIYKMSVCERTSLNSGCPICGKIKRKSSLRKTAEIKAVINKNTLKEKYPNIWNELDFDKNLKLFSDIDLNNISYSSNIKLYWLCSLCRNSYFISPNNRTNRYCSCPLCGLKHKSIPEISLFEIIKAVDNNATSGFLFEGKECDIYSEILNLFLEYDGYYWHKDKKDYDLEKSKLFNNYGKSIRIIETLDKNKLDIKKEIIDNIIFYYVQTNYTKKYFSQIRFIINDILNKDINEDEIKNIFLEVKRKYSLNSKGGVHDKS